jgi:hypothetical protein
MIWLSCRWVDDSSCAMFPLWRCRYWRILLYGGVANGGSCIELTSRQTWTLTMNVSAWSRTRPCTGCSFDPATGIRWCATGYCNGALRPDQCGKRPATPAKFNLRYTRDKDNHNADAGNYPGRRVTTSFYEVHKTSFFLEPSRRTTCNIGVLY